MIIVSYLSKFRKKIKLKFYYTEKSEEDIS